MTKILIIEDEPLIAKMYKKTLAKEGFEVVVAAGGIKGIEACNKEKPDLILLDLLMQDPDGMKVLSKIKSNSETKSIPVVILTNVAGDSDRELAMKKGASDYWLKEEVNAVDLGEKIKGTLENAETKE